MRKPVSLMLIIWSLSATAARAEIVEVSDKHAVADDKLSRQGVQVRIVGPCQSNCSGVLAQVPRNRICVTDEASLGFHLPKGEDGRAALRPTYPYDIRAWIHRRGGLTHEVVWMEAPEIYRFFRKC
jgi:hypothetical protein